MSDRQASHVQWYPQCGSGRPKSAQSRSQQVSCVGSLAGQGVFVARHCDQFVRVASKRACENSLGAIRGRLTTFRLSGCAEGDVPGAMSRILADPGHQGIAAPPLRPSADGLRLFPRINCSWVLRKPSNWPRARKRRISLLPPSAPGASCTSGTSSQAETA